ncbi:hypothetical protein [Streptomyces sp. NPDC001530]|uniref:hypothetical protein n=1 Tax=Streptomyces sp. NPDC001530 TaxID=3364582 RepID=UPI003676F0EC
MPEHVEGGAPAEERSEVPVTGDLGVRHVQLRLPVAEYVAQSFNRVCFLRGGRGSEE